MKRTIARAVVVCLATSALLFGAATPASASCASDAKSATPASNESVSKLSECGNPTGALLSFTLAGTTVTIEIPPLGESTSMEAALVPGATGIEQATVTHFDDGGIGFYYASSSESHFGGDTLGEAQMIAAKAEAQQESVAARASAKCSSTAYALLGTYQVGQYEYWINTTAGGMPAGGSARIQAAAASVSDATNGCGFTGTTGIPDVYKGTTTLTTQVTANIGCNARDNYSVHKFGVLNNANYVAITCRWAAAGGWMYGSDTVYNNSKSFYAGLSITGCTGATTFDLQHIATHEILHAYGLDHVSDTTQVAASGNFYCLTSGRILGGGDYAGLMAIY